jgi:hypothetical protein
VNEEPRRRSDWFPRYVQAPPLLGCVGIRRARDSSFRSCAGTIKRCQYGNMNSPQQSAGPESPNWFIYTPKVRRRNSDTRHPATPPSLVATETDPSGVDSPGPDISPTTFSSIAWQGPASQGSQVPAIPSPKTTGLDAEDLPLTTSTVVANSRRAEPVSPHVPLIRVPSQEAFSPRRQHQSNPVLVHPSPTRHSQPSWISPASSPEYQVQSTPPSSSTGRISQTQGISQPTTQHPTPPTSPTTSPRPADNRPTAPIDPTVTSTSTQRLRPRRRPAPLLLHDPVPRPQHLPRPRQVRHTPSSSHMSLPQPQPPTGTATATETMTPPALSPLENPSHRPVSDYSVIHS